MTDPRQQAHRLIDELPQAQVAALVGLLETIVKADAEELPDADRRAAAASREYFRQNPEGGLSIEDLAAECGVTMDQVREHGGE
jgi:hypothetical protein